MMTENKGNCYAKLKIRKWMPILPDFHPLYEEFHLLGWPLVSLANVGQPYQLAY